MRMQMHEPHSNKKQRSKQFPWVLWVVVGVVIMAIVAFTVTAFIILRNQGTTQGISTLTVISILTGVVIGLLGLLVSFLQWHHPRSPIAPEPSTAPQTSSHRTQTIRSTIESTASSNTIISHSSPGTTSGLAGERFNNVADIITDISSKVDWGAAPYVDNFYGREQDSTILARWILEDKCRMVAILGIGGIGKTTLAATVARETKDSFEYIFWRSLQNAPPIENFLERCILFLSNQQRADLPENVDDQISLFLTYLQDHRCLIVLDNVESVLQAGNRAGQYREGYEAYGRLMLRVGESQHQSCLLLTGREKPKDLALLEGNNTPVRSWHLLGMGQLEGKQLLKEKGLSGTDDAWNDLIRLYSGNPLALKVVSEFIREVFGGDIAEFLKEDEPVFGDIDDLLNQQFSRLTELEREILYWLAIEREDISIDELQKDLVRPELKRELLEVFWSLRRRSMVEIHETSNYSLQPVIMEYVTDKFIEQVLQEIDTEKIELMSRHALIKAQAKDYIREIQIRLILEPIATQLLASMKILECEVKLKKMLSILRESSPQIAGYAAGNILNLLIQLKIDLQGYDFSHLTVWQAYLPVVALRDVNFMQADLAKSVFADNFNSVFSVALSQDGKLLAAGTANGDVRVWETANTTPMYTLQGHTEWIRAVVFSPSGNILASGSEDQTVRLWNVQTGECIGILQGHHSRVYSVAFSSDENIIASGSDDQTVRLWNVSTHECFSVLQGHKAMVYSVAFSPEGNIVAGGSGDQTIRIWKINDGECITILTGHTNRVRSIDFSPDGSTLVSGSGDQTVRLWRVDTGSCIRTFIGHTNWIWSVAFNSDGSKVISGSDDKTIRIWDINTGQCLRTIEAHGSRVYSVCVSNSGNIVASGNDGQTVQLWDTYTGECLKTLQGYGSRVYSVAYSPKSNIFASGGEDRIVRLWNTLNGVCFREIHGQTHWVWSVAFSFDGSMLATGGEDRIINLWNVNTGAKIKSFTGHANRVFMVAFSPDGSIIVSSSGDQTVKLWDVSTGECLKTLQGHNGRVYSVAFSCDGKNLGSSSDDRTIKIWQADTGVCINTIEGLTNRVRSVTFSPDGKLIAGGDDKIVKVWAINSGECLKTMQGHSQGIWSVAFSPDGNSLVSGSEDKTVRLWDISSGICLNNLHNGTIYSVVFGPDKSIVAGSSDDGIIKIWNAHTGECQYTLRSNRPYERMNITKVRGLTPAQKATLKALGAIEQD